MFNYRSDMCSVFIIYGCLWFMLESVDQSCLIFCRRREKVENLSVLACGNKSFEGQSFDTTTITSKSQQHNIHIHIGHQKDTT